MDLNKTQPQPQEALAPATGRLRAVRLPREQLDELADLPDPSEFDAQAPVGESLGDLLAADELQDLDPLQYDPEQTIGEAIAEHTQGRYGAGPTGDSLRDLAVAEHMERVSKQLVAPGPPNGTRHLCFVTPCRWYLDVPPLPADLGSIMGGPSRAALEQAAEVEELLTSHLSTHTVIEWATALRKAQDEAKAARAPQLSSGYVPFEHTERLTDIAVAYPPGMVTPQGAPTPGPAQRDPERAAAVAALDARLGRGRPPADPQEAALRDQQIRESRARLRARQPSPYDLTPAWSPEQGDGTVGIKR